jgi:cell division protein FtsI/penicillin-binding protein 2
VVVGNLPQRFQRRLLAVALLLILLLFLLVLQLVRWHALPHPGILSAAAAQPYTPQTYVARGNIVDRHGNLLATDVYRWTVGISPSVVVDKEKVAQELAPLLKQSVVDLLGKMTANPDAQYVILASDVDESIGEQINDLHRFGVSAEPHPRRYYPQGSLGAHVVGFVNAEGQAYYGVEEFYQEFLTGASTLRNAPSGSEALPDAFAAYVPSPAGRDLVLTLDAGIQYLVEAQLKHALSYYGAQAGTIIVLDPKTGEILASASQPDFDPNRYFDGAGKGWANGAISLPYEPGSVVKVVTMAAGLDAGAITMDQRFIDSGLLEVGGYEIRNSDRLAHGSVTLTDILAQSLNVGAAEISLQMGKGIFYDYLQRFGFGQVTEIDLAGELPGLVKDPNSAVWSQSDLATNAYGQGLTVTPLQLIAAVAAIANDGVSIRPHLVSKMVESGRVISVRPRPNPRAIKVETARALRQIMADATTRGIDANLVPGYRVAGKTGTAQVPTSTGYSEDMTIATYVAFLPADDPRVVVLVKLDHPTRSQWASEVTVPVFQSVATELVRLLDIPPDSIRLSRQ